MKTAVSFICLLAAVSVFAEKQPFERYQTIVDRQMFGPLPPGFDPTKPPSEVSRSDMSEKELTKEQEQLKSAIHFSVINVASDGQTEVGFTDNSNPKAPRHYFLKVGESRDGWTVKEADAEKASMTIAKDEIEVTLTLGGNSANTAGATSRAGVAASPQSGGSGSLRSGLLGRGAGSSISERRLLRQQAAAAEKAKADEAAAAREAERQAQAEQEKQQREAERAEQRQQLLAIQEELKRVREAKASAQSESGDAGSANNEVE